MKQSEVYNETKAGKVRQLMTPQAIAGKLRDANDEELLESAYKWCDQCWNYECPEGMTWWKWSHWLGRYLFLFEWDVEEETEGEKKSAITQLSNKVNLFEQAAQARKAILNYADKCGVKASVVSLKLVKATPMGIAGWATAGETDPGLGGRPKRQLGRTVRDGSAPRNGTKTKVAAAVIAEACEEESEDDVPIVALKATTKEKAQAKMRTDVDAKQKATAKARQRKGQR